MPITRKGLQEHPLWEQINELRRAAKEALPSTSPMEAEAVSSWLEVSTYADRLCDLPHWRFTSTAILDSLNQQAVQAIQILNSIAAGEEREQGHTLSAALDIFVQALNQAPPNNVTSGHLKGVADLVPQISNASRDAIASLKAATQEALGKLESDAQEVRSTLENLKTQVNHQSHRVELQTDDISKEFRGWLEARSEEYDSLRGDSETSLNEALSHAQASSKERLSEMEGLVEKTKSMVHVAARNTISTDYAKYAQNQGVAALLWSLGAVVFAVIALIYFIATVSDVKEITVGESLFKATVSTAVLGTAAFMGREASGHRREARDAKRTQLDLNTIEPYIANMPVDEARILRRQLAERIFSRPLANPSRQSFHAWGAEVNDDTSPNTGQTEET